MGGKLHDIAMTFLTTTLLLKWTLLIREGLKVFRMLGYATNLHRERGLG